MTDFDENIPAFGCEFPGNPLEIDPQELFL